MTGTDLSAAVFQSVKTGQAPTFTLADILAASAKPNSHTLVTVDVPNLGSIGLQQIGALFAGHSILDLVPPELTAIVDVLTAELTLSPVSYELLLNNTLATVAVSLGLVTPPSFNLFGDANLKVTIASIDLSPANASSAPAVSMVLNGTLALDTAQAAPTLDVALFVPELNLLARMPSDFSPLPVSSFLTPLGVSTTLFDSMAVQIFNFELDVRSEGLMLEVALIDPPSPVVNADGFSLQSITFSLEIGSGQLSLGVDSTIMVTVVTSQKALAFDANTSDPGRVAVARRRRRRRHRDTAPLRHGDGRVHPGDGATGSIAGEVLHWTDPLMGLQGWPGLSFSYSFATAAGGDRVLDLALNWSQPTSLSSERMGELIATLARAYHQLPPRAPTRFRRPSPERCSRA